MDAVGVRFDALHFARQTLSHPWPVVNLAVRVDEGDVGVRVDDARHAKVLVDTLPSSLILCLHPAGDFQAVFFHRTVGALPQLTPFVGFRGFVFARVKPDIDDGRRGLGCDF